MRARLMRWLMSTMRRCIHRRRLLPYRSKCIVSIGRCDCRIHGSPWHWHICRPNRFIEESIRYGNNYAKKFQRIISGKWWKNKIRINSRNLHFSVKNEKKPQRHLRLGDTYIDASTGVASFALRILNGKKTAKMQPLKNERNT